MGDRLRTARDAAPEAVVHRSMLPRLRLALTALLAAWGFACLRHPEDGWLLSGVDLAVHETGHLVFAPFGELAGFAGGTLLQLLMPAAFVAYFLRRGERHSASVALWWIAQNLWNVSVYAGDARAESLPLVGGGEHDWAYLLGRFGWLEHDAGVARGFHFAGVLVYLAAVCWGAAAAVDRAPTADGAPDAAGVAAS
jgi:hypothetical protein